MRPASPRSDSRAKTFCVHRRLLPGRCIVLTWLVERTRCSASEVTTSIPVWLRAGLRLSAPVTGGLHLCGCEPVGLRDGGQILPTANRCPSTGTKHAGKEVRALCSQRGGDRETNGDVGCDHGPRNRGFIERGATTLERRIYVGKLGIRGSLMRCRIIGLEWFVQRPKDRPRRWPGVRPTTRTAENQEW